MNQLFSRKTQAAYYLRLTIPENWFSILKFCRFVPNIEIMLRIFRTGSNLQLLLVLLAALMLWSDALFLSYLMPLSLKTEPFYTIVYNLAHKTPLISTILGLIVLLGAALLLNRTLSDLNILPRNSYITAFTYVVLMSSQKEFLTLHPLLLGHLFIVLMIRMIFRFYERQDDYAGIFNAGFFAGLATFFSLSLLPLVFLIWLSLLSFRRGSIREWIIPLTGFLLPYIFLFSFHFWLDSFYTSIDLYKNYFYTLFNTELNYNFSTYRILTSAVTLIILLQSFYYLLSCINDKIISHRKMYTVVLWLLLLSLASCLMSLSSFSFLITPIFIPLSVLMAHRYINSKKLLIDEILLLLFIAAIILQKIFT